jgi:hypothetical protein
MRQARRRFHLTVPYMRLCSSPARCLSYSLLCLLTLLSSVCETQYVAGDCTRTGQPVWRQRRVMCGTVQTIPRTEPDVLRACLLSAY